MLSVNTNIGAMAALQSLNQTQMQLQMTQSHINTGLKVASPRTTAPSTPSRRTCAATWPAIKR